MMKILIETTYRKWVMEVSEKGWKRNKFNGDRLCAYFGYIDHSSIMPPYY